MTNITKIGIAGDWHGNWQWATSQIKSMATRLQDEDFRIILQLGDFGYWEADDKYIREVSKACVDNDATVYFIDGNHENHDLLDTYKDETFESEGLPGAKVVEVELGVYWITRGSRWDWHGKTWLALGGAVSVDQNHRREGFDWFPQEEISWKEAATVISDGKADVMITHDCPAIYEPYGSNKGSSNPYGFRWDLLQKSQAHAKKLQDVVDEVQPSYLYHGHHHTFYQHTAECHYGPLNLTGLHCDGSQYNWGILDIESMEFHL